MDLSYQSRDTSPVLEESLSTSKMEESELAEVSEVYSSLESSSEVDTTRFFLSFFKSSSSSLRLRITRLDIALPLISTLSDES